MLLNNQLIEQGIMVCAVILTASVVVFLLRGPLAS